MLLPALQRLSTPRLAGVVAALACVMGTRDALSQPATRNGAFDATEAGTTPKELEGIGITDHSGRTIPGDITLVRHDGVSVQSASLFDDKRPVVFVLAYYSCPMLCTLVLNGLADGLKEVAWTAGGAFRVVTVSIDERDTTAIAAAKRANYLEEYGRPVTGDGWDFYTAAPAEVKRLADALGFAYRWDAAEQQFAHAAGAFIVTPKGMISRTLYGIAFAERDLRLSLVEAGEGRVGTLMDAVLLFCFHYDAQARGYVLAAKRVMQAGGLLTVLVLGAWLTVLWRRERAAALRLKEA